MRYHWGLGIGHIHSGVRDVESSSFPAQLTEANDVHHSDIQLEPDSITQTTGKTRSSYLVQLSWYLIQPTLQVPNVEEPQDYEDDPELGMEERENEDLGDDFEMWEDDLPWPDDAEESDDEVFLETYNMFNVG